MTGFAGSPPAGIEGHWLLRTALLRGTWPCAPRHGACHFIPLLTSSLKYTKSPVESRGASFTVLLRVAKFLSRKTRMIQKCHPPSGWAGTTNTPSLLAFIIRSQFQFKLKIVSLLSFSLMFALLQHLHKNDQ